MSESKRLIVCAVLLSSFLATRLSGDEQKKVHTSPWQGYFLSLAKECRMSTQGSEDSFDLVEQPLLRWSQPIRGGDDGAVYMWLQGDRPAAIGTIFAWPHPDGDSVVAYEFHSLTETPFSARWRGRVIWAPATGGVSFTEVPDSQPPSETAARRKLQQRSIARRFAGATKTTDGIERSLRLLSKPIYQYGNPKATDSSNERREFRQGALFVLAEGTDPEALILLEARRHKDVYRWEYSCA